MMVKRLNNEFRKLRKKTFIFQYKLVEMAKKHRQTHTLPPLIPYTLATQSTQTHLRETYLEVVHYTLLNKRLNTELIKYKSRKKEMNRG